jgi:hypothetical protein
MLVARDRRWWFGVDTAAGSIPVRDARTAVVTGAGRDPDREP